MDYTDRKLSHVGVWALEGAHTSETEFAISGSVRLQITNFEGASHGPSVTVELGAPTDPNVTIQDAERVLLAAALSLLARLSKETPEAVEAMLRRSRSDALAKPPED